MSERPSTQLNPVQLARRVEIGEERRRRSRGRILEATYRLFAVHGYDAPTIDDIAAEAGVSRGTFYNHFQTREAPFNAVADIIATSINDVITPRLAGIADPARRISMALRLFAHFAVVDAATGWILLRTMPLVGPLNLDMKTFIHAEFAEAIGSGRFRAAEVSIAVDLAFGLMIMTIHRLLNEDCGDEHIALVAKSLLMAMGLDEAEATSISAAPLEFSGSAPAPLAAILRDLPSAGPQT